MLVLKSNPHIKKGKYTKHKNNILIESGYYSYNQKDSFWEYFSKQGKLMAKGFYKDGDKKGIWEYYSINSDLIQTYDHDNDSLTYYNIEKEKELYPYLAPQKNQMIVLKCAILLGDWAIYIEYLKTKHYTRK